MSTHFAKVTLIVWFTLSTISEHCMYVVCMYICTYTDLYAVCSFHLIFTALQTNWSNSATNVGPLSDPILKGNPNLAYTGPFPLLS